MMLGRPTGSTPFAFAYGMDAVIPIEIGMPTAQTAVQGQRNEDLKPKTPGLGRRNKRKHIHPDGCLSVKGNCILQLKGAAPHLQSRNVCPKESL